MTSIPSLCSVLSILQGWAVVPNALERPTVFLEEPISLDALSRLTTGEGSRISAHGMETLFADARSLLFGGSTDRRDEIGWTYGLLRVAHRPDRGIGDLAALAPFFVVEDNLFTTPVVANGLMLRLGDRMTASVGPL
ncbi:MAG TPA: hypothetical protein VLJ37_01740 [bacterium]|nr:hypothetical protein [bacterium]